MGTEEDLDEGELSDDGENEVVLGFARDPEPRYILQRQFFPSKIGGAPAWLDPVQLPGEEESKCQSCGKPLKFLLQVYAPVDDVHDAFHRTLFVFTCSNEGCLRGDKGVRAFRCQLPRENEFYDYHPPVEDEDTIARFAREDKASRTPHFDGPWREKELFTEPEPDGVDANGNCEGIGDLLGKKCSIGEEGGEGGEGEDINIDELDLDQGPAQEQWIRFQSRLSRDPSQCIRYCYDEGAAPLWPCLDDQPASVPACPHCGDARRFEFQILPQVLFYLGIDQDATLGDLDFSTIAIYTCSCSKGPAYAQEFCWVQRAIKE